MLAGMLTGQLWLWKRDMLTEAGGLDILDYVKWVYCLITSAKDAPFPACYVVKGACEFNTYNVSTLANTTDCDSHGCRCFT